MLLMILKSVGTLTKVGTEQPGTERDENGNKTNGDYLPLVEFLV